MTLRYYANAPATSLTSSCSSAATVIEVASVAGLPIQYPFTMILDRAQATEEVVSVTNASGLTLTVARGIDSTTAFAHAVGALATPGFSAQDLREANAHVNASTTVHGITGSVVGTTDTQVLTNKTIGNSNTLNGFTPSRMAVIDATGKLAPMASSFVPAVSVVGTTDGQTVTNKTINFANNTLTGVCSLTGVEVLTNKTLTSPVINGLTLDTVNISAQWDTPTVTLINWTLGNGTLVTRGKLVGKTWHFNISFTFGGTSAASSTFVLDLGSLVPKQAAELGYPVTGNVWAQDASVPTNLYFSPVLNGTTGRIQARDAAGTNLNSTTFPWATGDRIVFTGSIEVA